MNAKVSVVIPVYNVEKYLRQCLDSVVNQTLRDIEIICIDDGATDHSGAILDEYAAHDDRIKVVHKENGGYGKGMNIGLGLATGEYIGIVEPDDFIELDTYETLYNKAKETGVDFVKANVWVFSSLKKYIIQTFRDRVCYNKVLNRSEYLLAYTDTACRIWSFIYKADFLKNNSIKFLETPGASYQDTSFWLKVIFDAKSGYFLDRAFYHYRIDNPNSSVHQNTKILNVVTELHEVERKYKKQPEILKLVNTIKLDKYRWNYQRLGDEGRKVFWPVFKKEIQKILSNHAYDERYFNASSQAQCCKDILQTHKNGLVKIIDSAKTRVLEKLSNVWQIIGQDTKISVIVPVYNAEKYLRECLDSLVNQTLKEIEIICVNDGSTDNSLAMLKEYKKKDARVKVMTQKNSGQACARNRALKRVSGKYIVFVDSDDYLSRDALAKLYDRAEKYGLDMLSYGGTNFNSETGSHIYNAAYEFGLLPKDFNTTQFNYKDCAAFATSLTVSCCLTMYRARFIRESKITFPEGLFFEDNVFFVKSLIQSNCCSILKEKLYYRRMHAGQTTSNWEPIFGDYIRISDLVLNYLCQMRVNPQIYHAYTRFYLNECIRRFNKYCNESRKKYYGSLKDLVQKYNANLMKEIKLPL